jgi:hypothetical protein
MKRTTHLQLVLRSAIRVSVHPLPIRLHGVMLNYLSTWTTVRLLWTLSELYVYLSINTGSRRTKVCDIVCLYQAVDAHRVVRSRLPHFLDSRLTDCGKVVSFTRQPLFIPQGRFLVLISVRGWVDPRAIARLEGQYFFYYLALQHGMAVF